MIKIRYTIWIVMVAMAYSCSTSKTVISQAEKDHIKAIVEYKVLNIESNWAYPQVTAATQRVMNSGLMGAGSNASSVNLIGNPNFLRISGDSVTSYLPYFGERQMQVTYGGMDGAIEFDGLMKHYQVTKNKHEGYNLTFEAKSKSNSENFKVFIILFPNENTEMTLSGNSRMPIRYSGNLVPAAVKKKDSI